MKTFFGIISKERSSSVFMQMLGASVLKLNNVGRHFCQDLQGFYFARIVRDFAQIFRDFARIFDKSKLLGVHLQPASYTTDGKAYT